MATQPQNRYTLQEYLDLEDTLGYRSEFHDGRILQVEAATLAHSRLEARVCSILDRAFFNRCETFGPSLNVYIASVDAIVHPDVTVVCGQADHPRPDCIDNPTILVEVLSPTTKDYDYGTKHGYYFSLPSLQHYLLISQSEMMVGHYERSGATWIYADRGMDATIFLGETQIPVADIYSGILV